MQGAAGPADSGWQTVIQIVLGATALGALMFAPPASGRMVMLPVTPRAAVVAPAVALRGGATLIGRGRLPGSLVVQGARSQLFWASLAAGSLLVAASPAGCDTR